MMSYLRWPARWIGFFIIVIGLGLSGSSTQKQINLDEENLHDPNSWFVPETKNGKQNIKPGLIDEHPKPLFTTSGAVGKSAVFRLPIAPTIATTSGHIQSISMWSNPFIEDFDDRDDINPVVWTVLDGNGNIGGDVTWGIDDNPYFTFNNSPHSIWVAAGGNDKRDSQMDNYPTDLESWLITKQPLDLSAVQMASVDFYMYYHTEPSKDWIFVGASVDGENFIGEYWTGSSAGFQYFNLDLAEFIGYPEVYLAWYFHSDSHPTVVDEGAWVDHISFWLQDTSPVQSVQFVENSNFEIGNLTSWNATGSVKVLDIENPNVGIYAAHLSGNSTLYQTINLGNDEATRAQIDFWVNLYGTETVQGNDRFCAGLYSVDRNARLLDLGCLDGSEVLSYTFDPSHWWHVNYLLSAEEWSNLRGREVTLKFELFNNAIKSTIALLDDVRFEFEARTPSDDEPNDTLSQATPLTHGMTLVEKSIDPDHDVDFYRFLATNGDLAIVDIDSTTFGTSLDSYVQVLDSTGTNVLCENDDDGSTMDSFLACEIQEDGSHYLRVSSYDGHGDRNYLYNLSFELQYTGEVTPTLPPPPDPIVSPLPSPNPEKPWTVLLYLTGDNNLCQSYEEMVARLGTKLADKLNDFLNIVVLLDRHPLYCQGDGNATRYVIQPNNTYTDGLNRWDMGEINTGDPQTLVNFVRWGMRNFPANHYFLSIDGFGGGLAGLAFDETNDKDHLTAKELYTSFKKITENGTQKFDLIYFHASLMGLFEVAYDFRNFTEYFLGFPTPAPMSLATYADYLSHPDFSDSSSGPDLANIILDTYPLSVTQPYALSLVRSEQMDEVASSFETWANALQGQVSASKDKIAQARSAAQKVDANGDGRLSDQDFYLDLWDLATQVESQGLLQSEAESLKNALEAAVIRSVYRSSGQLDYSRNHGLSIYFPYLPSIGYSFYVRDKVYSASRSGIWDEFLATYFAELEWLGMSVEPNPIAHPSHGLFLPTVMKP